jgi:hypothetical protein
MRARRSGVVDALIVLVSALLAYWLLIQLLGATA